MQRSWEKSWRRSRYAADVIYHRVSLKRRLRAKAIQRRRSSASGWSLFARYADELAFGQKEMARALRKFLRAEGFAACGVLVLNPPLLMESGTEMLGYAIARATASGDEAGKQLLERHLEMLRLARKEGVIAVVRTFQQQ